MAEKAEATVAYLFLVSGVVARKNRRIHPVLMACGLSMDLAIVLFLQFQRGVIQDALTQSYTLLQRGHILASTIAFVLYFPVMILGVMRLLDRAGSGVRTWHIRTALTAFSFRSVGFLLMFQI